MKKILGLSLSSILLCGNTYAFWQTSMTATCTEHINNGEQHSYHLTIEKTGVTLAPKILGARFTWKCSDDYIVHGQGFYAEQDNRYLILFKNGVEYLTPTSDGKKLTGTVMWRDGSSGSENCTWQPSADTQVK